MAARRGLAPLLLALAFGLPACGGPPTVAPVAERHDEAQWQDLLDTLPELLVIVRPQTLRRDRVYGPLLRRAIAAARQRSTIVDATHALDTIEDAEEVVIGARPEGRDRPGELLFVERGVRADVDPAKLVDDGGHALWAPGPSGLVRELVRERDAQGHTVDASLFELPGRTWVVVTGGARQRARDAFAHPLHRPPLDLDATALAMARIDGPSLVSRIGALKDLGALGAVGRRLQWVTFALPPGGEGSLKATLSYADEDAAAFAEVVLRQVVEAIGRKKPPRFAWLAGATVDRPGKRITVTAPLPPQLIDGLLTAGSAPLDLLSPDVAPGP